MDFYLIKYLHFIGIFGVVASLAIEWLLTKKRLDSSTISLLAKVDGVYGVSSILVLAAGFIMWFGVGKPTEYYNANSLLHLKVGIFAIIGALSIYPSIFFFKNRKHSEATLEVPSLILTLIKIEIVLLLTIPFLATLMADGRSSIF